MSRGHLGVSIGLLMASSASAQELNTPRAQDERPMIIDAFVPLSERAPGHLPPPSEAGHELPADLEDTFFLHSNPGATKVVYLDFDGHTIMWRGKEFVYDGWDWDGDPEVYSDDELAIIQLAWKSMSEDFLPFDIDITTEEPHWLHQFVVPLCACLSFCTQREHEARADSEEQRSKHSSTTTARGASTPVHECGMECSCSCGWGSCCAQANRQIT